MCRDGGAPARIFAAIAPLQSRSGGTIVTDYTAGKFSRRGWPTQRPGVSAAFTGRVVIAVWCKNCRQEVPAVCEGADQEPCCVRCGAAMPHGAQSPASLARSRAARVTVSRASRQEGQREALATIVRDAPTVTIRAPLSAFDTWELEEQLRHVDRILSGARFSTQVDDQTCEIRRADQAMPARSVSPAASATSARRGRTRVAWMIVSFGAAALAAGIVLLCAGAFLGRSAWQSIGLPITLLGQVGLLLGMMMQLDLVWKGKRETASKLYRFQKRLVDLEALAAELAPATTEDTSPPSDELQVMADLKSRLDVLSHRLNLPCG
jgi:hypothetical protein